MLRYVPPLAFLAGGLVLVTQRPDSAQILLALVVGVVGLFLIHLILSSAQSGLEGCGCALLLLLLLAAVPVTLELGLGFLILLVLSLWLGRGLDVAWAAYQAHPTRRIHRRVAAAQRDLVAEQTAYLHRVAALLTPRQRFYLRASLFLRGLMMTKKTDDPLGLGTLPSLPGDPLPGALVPTSLGTPRTRHEQRLVDEYRSQVMQETATWLKGRLGTSIIAGMHQQTFSVFTETVAALVARKAQTSDPEVQQLTTAFLEQQVKLLARHLFGISEVVASALLEHVQRAVEPPPEVVSPPPPSLWAKLFG